MSDPESAQPELHPKDQQIGTLFNVVGHVSRDPDPSGFGYTYDGSIAERLGYVSSQLQERHGLDKREVFDRFMVASELAVVIRLHVEPRLNENMSPRLN